jgi:hypothetical protein
MPAPVTARQPGDWPQAERAIEMTASEVIKNPERINSSIIGKRGVGATILSRRQ